MEKRLKIIERLGGLVVGFAFVIVGFFLMTLGLTLLPVIGILLAIPVMAMSLYFLIPELHVGTMEEEVPITCEEEGTCCRWPQGLYHKNAA